MAISGDIVGCGGMATPVPQVALSLHSDLAAVEGEWRDFEQRADCTVFQSFGWLSTWHRHIGVRKGTRPAIVIGRDAAGQMLFVLPLAVEGRGFARCLTWLGCETSDYNAPLLAPDFSRVLGPLLFVALWPRILERIRGQRDLRFDYIHFVRMPQKLGAQENPFAHLPATRHQSGAYLAHLSGDWETFYANSRSPATRRRDRRKHKHLTEMGEVRFITPQSSDEKAQCFDVLVSQKTRAFAAMGVPSLFRRPGHAQFYRSLVLDPGTQHIAHMSRLQVGDTAAAISLGLTFRGNYYLVLSSYAAELSRLSPGSAHLHELMRHAIESGCKVFDFTVGDEEYKRDWSDTESGLLDHVSATRWRGAVVAVPVLGLTRAKRTIKQTPILWKMFSKARALVGAFVGALVARVRAG